MPVRSKRGTPSDQLGARGLKLETAARRMGRRTPARRSTMSGVSDAPASDVNALAHLHSDVQPPSQAPGSYFDGLLAQPIPLLSGGHVMSYPATEAFDMFARSRKDTACMRPKTGSRRRSTLCMILRCSAGVYSSSSSTLRVSSTCSLAAFSGMLARACSSIEAI